MTLFNKPTTISAGRIFILFFLEWILLLSALVAITITETYQPYVTVALVLLGLSSTLRMVRTNRFVPHTGMGLPGLLFIISAGVATWAAYDPLTALLQFSRILAAAALFYAVIDCTLVTHPLKNFKSKTTIPGTNRQVLSYRWLRWLAAGFLLAAASLAIYWPIHHDFIIEPSKFSIFNQIGTRLNTIFPNIPGPAIHSNVAGGTLAVAIPFGIFLCLDYFRQNRRFLALLVLGETVIIFFGLLLTGSRGAWLGLAASFSLMLLVIVQHKWFSMPRARTYFWALITLGMVGVIALILASGRLESLLGKIPDPTGAIQNRPRLWLESIPLIRDYFFTGSGLVSYFFVFPTYSLLTHVSLLAHSHNFLLEIWIEQGVLGLIAALWAMIVILSWAWRALSADPAYHPDMVNVDQTDLARDQTYLGWAGLASIVIIAVHGVVDVVFYIERTLPLLGFIAGFAFLAVPARLPTSEKRNINQASRMKRLIIVSCLLIILLIIGLIYTNSVLGLWYANLGAILQTKSELTRYSQVSFADMTLDDVRNQVNLDPALSNFKNSLAADPNNLTALQRLASIHLSRGEYPQAMQLLLIAVSNGHQDERTRLLYGDALVANGQVAEAAEILTGILGAEDRLMYQSWYRYMKNNDYRRAISTLETVLRINPMNSQAQTSLDDLKNSLNNP